MHFGLLGPLEVLDDDGRRVAVDRPRARQLLGFLLLHANKPVSPERLVDELRGLEPPATAKASLQNHVSSLRKVLGSDTLAASRGGYMVRVDPDQVDVFRFERLVAEARSAPVAERADKLAAALGLWRGPALADAACDSFMVADARRLEELRLTALEDRIEADLALGLSAELVPELEALIAEHPLRERLRAQLMLALYRCGRQADALEVFRATRSVLVDEFGLEPSQELRELERRILVQDPALGVRPVVALATSRPPTPTTRLIGREREVAELEALISRPDVRLVTLTGTGGVGKTRLAMEVLARLVGEFDATVFVPLAPLRDPSLVLPAIADVLKVREWDDSLAATLGRALADRRLLALLDNVEHLLGAAPDLASLLLSAPQLKLVLTSRVRLRLSGEYVFDVRPLKQAAAKMLFSERAAAWSSVELTEADEEAIIGICERVDRLPLGIELAAAQVELLPPPALLRRLDQRLAQIGEGARDLPARQRTLRTTIDWSHDLLDDGERVLLRRLSVFAGGCTLEAAQAVAGATPKTLGRLVDASLVVRQREGHEGIRFLLLQTVREYAAEQLAESGEGDRLRRRHAAYVIALARRCRVGRFREDAAQAIRTLARELPNVRAAWEWLQQTGRERLALRLAILADSLWRISGHLHEGRRQLEQGLEREPPTHLRMTALGLLGLIVSEIGDEDAAKRIAEERLSLATAVGAPKDVGDSLMLAAIAHATAGEFDAARRFLDEAVSVARQIGDTRLLAAALANRGKLAWRQGNYERAEADIGESLLLRTGIQHTNDVVALSHLGVVAFEKGEHERALRLLHESLVLAHSLEYELELGFIFDCAAAVHAGLGEPERAARLLGAAEAAHDALGMHPDYARYQHDRSMATVRGQLPEHDFESLRNEGRQLPLQRAIEEALGNPEKMLRAPERGA